MLGFFAPSASGWADCFIALVGNLKRVGKVPARFGCDHSNVDPPLLGTRVRYQRENPGGDFRRKLKALRIRVCFFPATLSWLV